MNETVKRYFDALHPKFEILIGMEPVKIATVPKGAPSRAVYLFSESGQHLYVGRTNHLRNRMRQHSIPAAQHNQAVFAFRLARKQTGRTLAAYSSEGGRVALSKDPDFAHAFTTSKARIREMDLRFVEETDPFQQALLEIYTAIALNTLHNDFENH
jgi:predicted GIY-YIG superfamily endonuclease